MCNKSTLDKILKEVSSAYKKVYGDKLVKVVLYGSYARGDYDEESDIDIVGIVRGSRLFLQKIQKDVRDMLVDLDLYYGIYISPKVVPYDEFSKYKNILPFYKNIVEEGVDIGA